MFFALVFVLVMGSWAQRTSKANMNGQYLVANEQHEGAFDTRFAGYPLASATATANEFFIVRSAPITSHYGQVSCSHVLAKAV